jgi:putative endonuclease
MHFLMTAPAKKKQAYQSGILSEALSAWVLRAKGYRILERRYRTPSGEIDLIARHGDTLVFVEVKFRKTLDAAAFAIEPRQQVRINKAAQSYLTRNRLPANVHLRFDAMLVSPWAPLKHIKNAWQ